MLDPRLRGDDRPFCNGLPRASQYDRLKNQSQRFAKKSVPVRSRSISIQGKLDLFADLNVSLDELAVV